MPKPFTIQVQVPLVNYGEPYYQADKFDAATVVATALNFFINSDLPEAFKLREQLFDDGLDLDGEFRVKDPNDNTWKDLEYYT